MQITSTANRIKSNLFFFIALPFQTFPASSVEFPVAFQLENKETLCVGGTKNKTADKCDRVIDSQPLDKTTRSILQRSDEVILVFSQPNDDGHYLVLIARMPSKSPQSTRYCGTGYEDHLILLTYVQKKIALKDEFILQSCLKSIALDSDGGDDILKAISINLSKYSIGFRWLTNPDNKDHTITVSDNKFLLE